MSEIALQLAFYIDADAPGGGRCLLDGLTSSNYRAGIVYGITGDRVPLRLYFRRRSAAAGGASTAAQWPAGSAVVLGGKVEAAGATLVRCSAFTLVAGDAPYYSGVLSLDTVALRDAALEAASDAITLLVDVEVRNAGNTERVTFRFSLTILAQVYSETDALQSLAHWGREFVDQTSGKRCIRISTSDGESLLLLTPSGVDPEQVVE